MGQENLYVQIEGLRSFVETHQDVAAQVTGLLGAAPHSAHVASTHGSIASAVHQALDGALDARRGAHQSVHALADQLAGSLQKATHHYEQEDQRAAAAARKAADGIDGSGQSPSLPAGTAPSAPAGGTQSNPAGAQGGSGQGLGQLGQLGGQMAQSLEGLGKGKGGGGNSLGQLVETAEQIAQQFTQGRGDSADDPADGTDRAQPGGDTAAGKPPTDQAPTQRTTPRPQ